MVGQARRLADAVGDFVEWIFRAGDLRAAGRDAVREIFVGEACGVMGLGAAQRAGGAARMGKEHGGKTAERKLEGVGGEGGSVCVRDGIAGAAFVRSAGGGMALREFAVRGTGGVVERRDAAVLGERGCGAGGVAVGDAGRAAGNYGPAFMESGH